jgi:ferric-dicitrate binding protein FerR (iron transport regulator)
MENDDTMSDEHSQSLPPELEARLASMPEDEADELRAVWRLLGPSAPASPLDPDAEAAWSRVRAHITESQAPSADDRDPVARRRRSGSARWVRAAVGVLLAVAVVGLLVWQRPVEVTTARGEQTTVTLPDGATVHMNSGSTIQYARGFSVLPLWPEDRRAVTLRGEAFFDVPDGERPFVVETQNARVTVLGTAFNVRARRERSGEQTDVALVSGRVALSSRSDRTARVTLTDGEAARIRGAGAPTPPRDTTVNRVLAWRDGGFWVVDRPVQDVVAALELRYDATIRVSDTVPADSVTLYYRTETDVETILGDMCEALGITYQTTTDGYLLLLTDE